MATKTTTTANANGARNVASEIAYLARALKAPTARFSCGTASRSRPLGELEP
jgi:hypothetical protein